MKIIHDFGGECRDGVNTYLDLEEFGDDSQEVVLFYGINSTLNRELQEQYKHYKRRILLDLWSPCDLYAQNDILEQDHFKAQEYFTDVFCICPFTVEWSNKITNTDKWKCVFYPWQPSIVPVNFEKKYDVCFVGGIHSQEHFDALQVIKKFNYRFISQSPFAEPTDINISNKEKLDLIAQCKIVVCFNLLYLKEDHWHFAMNNYNLAGNMAFNHPRAIGTVNPTYTAPQFKSRSHEAASGKSLILCKKDEWDLINYYYDEDSFVFFDQVDDLESTISNILENYQNYQSKIDLAYQRVYNFTTKNLIYYIEGFTK